MQVGARAVTFRLTRAPGSVGPEGAPCGGTLVLREGGRRLGTAAFAGTQGTFDVRVALDAAGRRRLRTTRTVTVAITGRAPHVAWQVPSRVGPA